MTDGADRSRLVLQVYLPQELFDRLGALTLKTRVDGVELDPAVLNSAGAHSVIRPVKGLGNEVLAEFELDKALEAKSAEERELAIIVASLELE